MWTARHEAEALHAVQNQALLACLSTSALGLTLLLICRREPTTVGEWLAVAIINGIALWAYISTNAVAYV